MNKEASEIFASALEADIKRQQEGQDHSIGLEWDDVYGQLLPIEEDFENPIYGIAFNFWDAWCDASNHEWQYYDPLTRNDWPLLAQEVIKSLRSGNMPTNEILIREFLPKPRESFVNRIKKWLNIAVEDRSDDDAAL